MLFSIVASSLLAFSEVGIRRPSRCKRHDKGLTHVNVVSLLELANYRSQAGPALQSFAAKQSDGCDRRTCNSSIAEKLCSMPTCKYVLFL